MVNKQRIYAKFLIINRKNKCIKHLEPKDIVSSFGK